jgi:glycerol-3-phosphate dehydrogenase (NAD(P)+)
VTRCAVIGAGAWGTALADLLARNGHVVRLWAYERDVAESVNARHANPRFLPGLTITHTVRATHELGDALDDAGLAFWVTPSHVLRHVLRTAAHAVPPAIPLVVATKGIERGSLAVMSDVVQEELHGRPVVALSGPSFAAEVAARQPTAVVAAASDLSAARLVQHACSNDTFRVYTHHDVVGVELGGALKNVMAIATGIAEGLGLGHNPRAALITRGLAEIARLGTALGAEAGTFAGLAGLGDLVLTCTGALSRNRALGVDIGRGASLDDLLAARETVAEGVVTTQSAHALAAREGIEMPIVAAVNQSPRAAMSELMRRELRAEADS